MKYALPDWLTHKITALAETMDESTTEVIEKALEAFIEHREAIFEINRDCERGSEIAAFYRRSKEKKCKTRIWIDIR